MSTLIYTSVRSPGIRFTRVKRAVEQVCGRLSYKDASIAVHFVGERRMRRLNRTYRGFDRPTDVLSFSLREGEEHQGENDWGDIFLCVPYIRRQAKRFDVSYEEECLRMLVHGVLHLAGFDHQTRRQAKQMFALQEEFL